MDFRALETSISTTMSTDVAGGVWGKIWGALLHRERGRKCRTMGEVAIGH
jgi:hypothetical protein